MKFLLNCCLLVFFLGINSFSQAPVASYPFNGNANDASGNGNHGTLQGSPPQPTQDRFGNPNSAYHFGGYFSPGWIMVANSPSLQFSHHFSISLWFRQCEPGGMDGWGAYSPTGYNVLYGKAGDGYAASPGIYAMNHMDAGGQLHISFNNKLCYGSAPGCSQLGLSSGVPCYDSCEWVHLVQVVDSNISRMYINGQLVDTSAFNGPANFAVANSKPLCIGRMVDGGNWYPFNGDIDDINIYNVALTQQEVTALLGGYVDPLAGSISSSADTICAGHSVTLTANGGTATIWIPDASIVSASGNTATAAPVATTTYYATITTANGCTGQAQKTIHVKPCNNCADTSRWVAYVQDAYNPPIQYYTPQQFVDNDNNWAFIPPSISPLGYYWSHYKLKDTMCITNNFSVEFRCKTGPPNGISAYDTYIGINTTGGECGVNLMGDAWGQPWTSLIIMGNTLLANSPSLIFPSLYDWTNVKLEFQDNNLNYYVNDQLFFSGPYTGDVCNIYGFHFLSKGSGYWDWIKVRDASGNLVYFEDFLGCDSLVDFTNNCESPVIDAIAAYVPCVSETLQLFANIISSNSFLSYEWTGPNSFTSTEQNPWIANPTPGASGWYYCEASTNVCNPTYKDSVFVNVQLSIDTTVNQSICQGASYAGYTASGTYVDTFASATGCDSIRTIHLTVNPTSATTQSITKCVNQLPFTWNGTTIPAGATSNPAYATYTTLNAQGCDSVVTLNLTVKPVSSYTQLVTKCANQLPFVWNGITIPAGSGSNPNAAAYSTTNTLGCDSVVTLSLTVKPTSAATQSITKCANELPFVWNGITIPAGATSNPAYTTFTASNTAGCDSVTTLHLTVQPASYFTQSITKCRNELPFIWNGITIPASATTNPAYATFTIPAANGCDSTTTLSLTIHDTSAITQTITKCSNELPFSWNGITIPEGSSSHPAFATFHAVNTQGCDSVTTLNLVVNSLSYHTQSIVKCANELPFVWNGVTIPAGTSSNPNYAVYHTVNAWGCDSTVTLNLTVHPVPVVGVLPADTGFCKGGSARLVASGATSYQWTPANGLNQSSGNAVTATPSQSIVYTVTGTDAHGCSNTATTSIVVHPVYDTMLIPVQICNDSVLLFDGIAIDTAGDYIFRFSSVSGCDSLVKLRVSEVQKPVATLVLPDDICAGERLSILPSSGTGQGVYDWDFNGGRIIFGQGAGPYGIVWTDTGMHHVAFTVNLTPCAAVSAQDSILVRALPEVRLSPLQDESICIRDEVQLVATYQHGWNYHWSPEAFFNDETGATALATIRKAGPITVTATDKFNCTASDSLFIDAQPCCTATLPSAFSPNGDGRNDVFRIVTVGHHEIVSFRVFNRYGQAVFETVDESRGWDGAFGGKPADVGTHFYHLRLRCADGKMTELKGDVLLVR